MSRLQRAALALTLTIAEQILRECGESWAGVRNAIAVLASEITRVRSDEA